MAVAGALALNPAHAENIKDLLGPTISDTARDASIIARVEIVNRTPVWAGGLVEKGNSFAAQNSCGYYYEAEVVESFKGNKNKFSFFSSVDSEFRGAGKDYLVFVYRRNSDEIQEEAIRISSMILTADESAKANLACKAFGEYYLPARRQYLFPFDSEVGKVLGGEWIEGPKRSTIIFCGGKPSGEFVEKLKDPQDKSSLVIEWSGIRKMILYAVKNRYRLWLEDDQRMLGC